MTLKYDKNTKLIGGFSIDIVDETDPVWSYMLRHNMLNENIDWVTEDVIEDLLEKPKVKLPKYIADKIEYCKYAEGYGVFHAMDYCFGYKDSAEWLEYNQETFARAWLDGYDIEKEKLYTAKLKLTDEYLAYDNDNVEYYFTDNRDTQEMYFDWYVKQRQEILNLKSEVTNGY